MWKCSKSASLSGSFFELGRPLLGLNLEKKLGTLKYSTVRGSRHTLVTSDTLYVKDEHFSFCWVFDELLNIFFRTFLMIEGRLLPWLLLPGLPSTLRPVAMSNRPPGVYLELFRD